MKKIILALCLLMSSSVYSDYSYHFQETQDEFTETLISLMTRAALDCSLNHVTSSCQHKNEIREFLIDNPSILAGDYLNDLDFKNPLYKHFAISVFVDLNRLKDIR